MKNILNFLLDFLLPRPGHVKLLESMDTETFRKSVALPYDNLPPWTFSIFDYKNPLVKKAIWEIKYRGNKKILNLLATCFYEELISELADRKIFENFDRPILVPIPMSKTKQNKRGFNQCELLAQALLKMNAGHSFELETKTLVKIKETESQTKKNRAERLANLKNSFAVSTPEKIRGRNIVLIDDVTTTGATFEEAEKTLLKAGARKVLCAAMGH